MRYLTFLSLMVFTLAFTMASALASQWVPIQIGGMTTFINPIDFRTIKHSPSQYTLTWLATDTSQPINYRIERLSLDPDAPITTKALPTQWVVIADTTDTSINVTHDFNAFDLQGLQQYRLSQCDANQCAILSELSYQLDRNQLDSLALQNLAIDISPIYTERFETRHSNKKRRSKNNDIVTNPYQQGYGFSMLSQHTNPNGHGIGSSTSTISKRQFLPSLFKSNNLKIVSNQAILTWDQVENADHYIIVKTDIRADYPTKSIVRDVAAEYKAITNTFVYELVGGEYRFEVFACQNDPNDNLPPVCGKQAILTSQSSVDFVESQMPRNLQLNEGDYASDGKVSENQSFTLTWQNPNQTILGDWDLVRFDVYGELNGKLTNAGQEILFSSGSYELTRNLGTKHAPYLIPGRQYCYKVIPIYQHRHTGEEDVGQFANPAPHKCMTVGNNGFIPAPDTFTVFHQPPSHLAGSSGYFLDWSAVPGAAYYQIDRYIDDVGWTPIYVGDDLYTLEYFEDNYYAIGLRLSACTQDNRCGNYRRLYFNTDNIQFDFISDEHKIVQCFYVPSLQPDASSLELRWCKNPHPDLKNYAIRKLGHNTPIVNTAAANYHTNPNGLHYYDVINNINSRDNSICFQLEATYDNDPSTYRSEYQCTQTRLSTPVPSIAVINKFTGHITLNWTQINNANHYNIQQAICQPDCASLTDNDWQDLATIYVNTSLELEGKKTNTYAYRIAACNSTQCGAYSNSVEFKPSQSRIIFIHTDQLGSPTVESTIDGEIQSTRMHYKAFGDSIGHQQDDVGYTGHKFDTDLGLSYMQARYYDPVIGRFYGNDPIGFRDVHSFNRFAYANNNPYKFVDPDGRNAMVAACGVGPNPVCVAGVAVLAGAAVYTGIKGTQDALNRSNHYNQSADGGSKDKVTVDDDGSGSVIITIDAGDREIEVMSDTPEVEGDRLILDGERGVHISTSDEKPVGLKGMRDAGRAIGEHYGVKEVEIRGGKRTSGANEGKIPRPVIIKVDK